MLSARRCLLLVTLGWAGGCTAALETTSHEHSASHGPEEDVPGEGEPGPIGESDEDTASSACGGTGQACCSGGVACSAGLSCIEGSCTPCGQLDQPCCDNGCSSPDSLSCSDGWCVPCGRKGQPCCNAPDMCPGDPVCKSGTCMVCCAVCKGGATSGSLDVDNDPFGCAEAVHDWCQGKCANPPCVNHDQSGWKASCN